MAFVVLLAIVAIGVLFAKLHSASRALSQDLVPCARLTQFSGERALNNTSCVAGKLRSRESDRSFAPASPDSWSNDERNRLRGALQSAFAPVLDGATGWSFAVISTGGRTIFDDRADRAVAPASVQKLVVAATALDALGPAYRYQTLFAAQDAIDDQGELAGNLWLIGSGDPSLTSDDLRNGIAMLARAGLRRISGALVVDDTTLSGPPLNPHWGRDDNGQDYAAPTSAISVDGDTIESRQEVGGMQERAWTPMQDVARYVAGRVNGMMLERGITPAAPPASGAAPLQSVVLWDHRSPPLQSLETHMLFVSDNHYAEQLLRTVGEQVTGVADDEGGLNAEREFLGRSMVPLPGLRLFDGSGLSADNRVAAITLARLLADREATLYLLLPRGGRDGTLRDYDFTTALGRVRAKSGHLSNVSALAGYVTTMHHGRVAFAFLINGSPGDPDAAIVRAVDRLATF
ncbi:MAG: D-alanyl-D-alanine carboxypeptidase/D-alanyl-D-alanine-endopeptidase [Candidatus Eremiobacteraeota bacterium]|nr:D-alanyl-D-alanine carboxypeptidase/D-alanyl-D-alanine-endopeptidase [Candidatus Eremiobacteraeota bacterium]